MRWIHIFILFLSVDELVTTAAKSLSSANSLILTKGRARL